MIVETRDPSLLKVRACRIDTFLYARKDSVSVIQPGKVIAKKLDFQKYILYIIDNITTAIVSGFLGNTIQTPVQP